MKTTRNTIWLLLAIVLTFTLACGVSTPTEEPTAATEPPTQEPAAAPAMGRINGRIEFQAPPTPASVLYAVNVNDPSQWFTRDLASSDGPTPFEIEVPAGTYQVYAHQVDGPMVAAYLNPDGALGSINVPSGQVVSEVLLKFAAPQNPCQGTTIPASPDGRFAAIEATSCPDMNSATEAPTAETLATIRGFIGANPGSMNTYMMYFVSAERWYWLEVPPNVNPANPPAFEWQVAPGTYQLIAYVIGSEGWDPGSYRPFAYGDSANGIGSLTVAAGQVVENISLQNINGSIGCPVFPIPASPEARFPALEVSTCTP